MKGFQALPLAVMLLAGSAWSRDRAVLVDHISQHYAEQLTNPQKKNRMSYAQFGYGMYYVPVKVNRIAEFINPLDFGPQSYSVPSKEEKNGALYSCKGGFIDFSHVRAAVDWTTNLTFRILTEQKDFDLPPESGTLKIHLQNLDKLTLEDTATLAQRIAFERLTWHEIASWHYHFPNHLIGEQLSAFTPEDMYSNYLGTLIGKNVALRILNNFETKTYSEIATEEIRKAVDSLDPMTKEEESMVAYDIVDRFKQSKLPEEKRNKDVWYDSEMILFDFRYIFKRNMDIGPEIHPWTVPGFPRCDGAQPVVLTVPQFTESGEDIHDFYEFAISPDKVLFYSKYNKKKQLHVPFGPFTTKDFPVVMEHIKKEMVQYLGEDFDKRDLKDPSQEFKKRKKMWFGPRK